MKTGISAEFAIKLGLAVGAGLLVYVVAKKASESIGQTFDAVGSVLGSVGESLNPASEQNVVNQVVTSIGNATVSQEGPGRNADGSWTFGGWLYDITHGDQISVQITGRPPRF